MKCESVADRIDLLMAGELPENERRDFMSHIAGCGDCRDALQGARALRIVRDQEVGATPDGLFDRTMRRTTLVRHRQGLRQRFWLGAGFGGAIAASLFAAALALGVFVSPAVDDAPEIARFFVSTDEARPMHIAIYADRPLPNARISVLLSGDVQIDGFGSRRELSWNDDLDAGTNKLTLPLKAIGQDGGQMIVRLSHPDSEQLFVVQLKVDG